MTTHHNEGERGQMSAKKTPLCGHTASGNGFVFVCDLPAEHPDQLHRQRTQLLDSVSVTNWGDDGLAPWATNDKRKARG